MPQLDEAFPTWTELTHKRIQPLLGYTATNEGVDLISPWWGNGNLRDFIRRDSGVDRLGLVSPDRRITGMILPTDSRRIADASGGRAGCPTWTTSTCCSRWRETCEEPLSKADTTMLIAPKENVFVNDDREAVLGEVGLADFFENLGSVRYGKAEDVRHLAPEFLETGKHTAEADIYAFGCLAMGEES